MFEEELKNKIEDYRRRTKDNELDVMTSARCGCLSCGHSFSARDIHYWVEDGSVLSARCPQCGLPYVIADSTGLPVDKKTMEEMNKTFLNNSKPDDFYDDIRKFCIDFNNGKLGSEDPNMIRIYEDYLHLLHEQFKDPAAAFTLGKLYAEGSIDVTPDANVAIQYFEDESLCQDGRSFYEAGLLYLARGERGDNRRAFEAFAKSSALGCLEGSMYIGVFYLHGNYVKADADFAVNTLLSVFGGLYNRAITEQTGWVELIFCSFHIGYCFAKGLGCPKSESRAMRYWLITDYFMKKYLEQVHAHLPWAEEFHKLYDELRQENGVPNGEILFDEDTFYESFFEQQDSTSVKYLNYMQYAEDTGNLRFGFSSTTPMLIVDTGNCGITQTNDTEWEMPAVKFSRMSNETVFHRFEFIGQYRLRFIYDDPIRGAEVIAELLFQPVEEGASENQ